MTTAVKVAIRPRLHFTAPQEWLNDPHGICWVDGEYHLFYQHNPTGREWAAAVNWGHATSPDLMHWAHQPIALTPGDAEEGCWTGATVIEDGRPTIFYTSVLAGDWNRGRIAVAFPDADLLRWHSTATDIVIEGPPQGLGASVFRDPCIFATDSGWTMIVGVGVQGGTGLAVQYTSVDRRAWTYTGVLCSRPDTETAGVWTGSMWECPQLFRVGDDWAFVVSVWDNETLFYVAAAIGSYDGTTFKPERWSRLTHDEIAYAMTSFTDNTGRPCVMFWLREDVDHDPDARDWAGALSLPMVVEVSSDRTLRLRPHPDVNTLRSAPPIFDGPLVDRVEVKDATRGMDVELPAADRRWTFTLTAATEQLLTVSSDGAALTVARPGEPPTRVPISGSTARVIVDAGIVEIFAGVGSAAFRIPANQEADLSITGRTDDPLTVDRLDPAIPAG